MEAPADISMDYKGKIRLATVTFGPICENTGGKLQTKRLRLFYLQNPHAMRTGKHVR